MSPELEKLLIQARAQVAAMMPEQRAEMLRLQGERWARAEAALPKPKYKWLNGAKVYDSYGDYCNG